MLKSGALAESQCRLVRLKGLGFGVWVGVWGLLFRGLGLRVLFWGPRPVTPVV